jgi:hypothetical protein
MITIWVVTVRKPRIFYLLTAGVSLIVRMRYRNLMFSSSVGILTVLVLQVCVLWAVWDNFE